MANISVSSLGLVALALVWCCAAERVSIRGTLGRELEYTTRFAIGITISIRKNESSVWVNGAKQNAFLMYQMYSHKNKYDVFLINLDLGSVEDAIVLGDWGVENFPVFTFDQAMRRPMHIVIESGMQLSVDQVRTLQSVGIRVASFRTGNDFFMISECVIYNQQGSNTFGTLGYDRIWTLPSYEESLTFQNVMFRAPVRMVPYVWSPVFHDLVAKQLTQRRKYTPRKKEKAIGVFEPNLFIVKNFIIPLTITESVYRQHPELIDMLFITNAEKFLSGNNEFLGFVGAIDIVKHNKTAFVPRFKLPWFLSERVDVVLSHQFYNNLNFLYLDALYAHYPLVHNAPAFKDCGYYYDASDVHAGAAQLLRAITTHDDHLEEYNKRADECVERFSVFREENLRGYEALMGDLLS